MSHKFAFHTDVQKMYHAVKLREEDWCLQRYIWQDELKPGTIPEEKVTKTIIYGVKSRGNQEEIKRKEVYLRPQIIFRWAYNLKHQTSETIY